MRIVNRDVMELCPRCNSTLRLNEELMIWQCTATRCQWRTPAYTVPDKHEVSPEPKLCPKCRRVLEARVSDSYGITSLYCDYCDFYPTDEDFAAPQEPEPALETTQEQPKQCAFCQHVLEYDHHVRDDFKWWCSSCNACFNDDGKAQPGQRIWYTVPEAAPLILTPVIAPEVKHLPELEAVAAAAVACFVRSGKDMVYMPGAKTRNDLQQAVENLLATGWRPKSS